MKLSIYKFTEQDITNQTEIFAQSYGYLEIDLNIVKQNSLPIINLKNKPKKKKNLLLELEKNFELPRLNINAKAQSTQVILTYNSAKSTSYRNLRKIQKAMKGYNCNVYKFAVNPQNNSQNIDLVRLLVSKSNKDKMIIEVTGKYLDFWHQNYSLLGGFCIDDA